MILLRSTLFNIWFVAVTIVVAGLGAPLRWVWRRHALRLAQVWAGLLLDGAAVICGIRVVVIGREHLPREGAALIASQHQSAYDTLIWLRLVPRVAYVFKAELSRVPLFGPLLIPAGQIPVDRGGVNAIRTLLRGADAAKADGRQIVMFPEGTRVPHGQEVELKPGLALVAKRTGLPVIPVATDSGLRWSRRAFRKRPGPVHIAFAPPIPPGLPQAELLAALRAGWRQAEAALAADLALPVDNSVHEVVAAMPVNRNLLI